MPAALQCYLLLSTRGILALWDYVCWELTPQTTYTDPRPSSAEEVKVERECECSVCLEKMAEVIGDISRWRPLKHL